MRLWSTEIDGNTKEQLKHFTLCCAGGDALVQWPFHPRAGGDALFYMTQTAAIFLLSPIICGTKKEKEKKREKENCTNVTTCAFFSGKVILAAVNLPSQITLLTLRISCVFSSLSSLNLLLSCPELSVASRARRSEVFKVDVWGGNRANADVAHGSLPSASFSPQACGACQLPLVSNSLTKTTPTHLHHSLLWGSQCVITQLRYTWGVWTLHHHHHRVASEGDRRSKRHSNQRVIEKAKYLILHLAK